MVEFFMSRSAADRRKHEVGGEMYHHSNRKYWEIANKTNCGDGFLAAHPYIVTDSIVTSQTVTRTEYATFGLLPDGTWKKFLGRTGSLESAEIRIEEYKSCMGDTGFPVYNNFKVMQRTVTICQEDWH